LISLKIRHIPIEIIHQIHLQSHEELRRREEIVYRQKLNVEQGYLIATRDTMKAVQENKDVEAEMSRIKEAIRALSQSFPEIVVKLEDTAEAAIRQVTNLVQNL